MKWLPNRSFRFASTFSLQDNSSSSHLIQQLRNCNELRSVSRIHSILLKSGLISDTFPANHLINGYVRLRKISDARRVFDEMPEPNVVSWTSLVAGYVGAGRPSFALWMYSKMFETSVTPNDFTVSTAINACSILAELETGKKIHAHAEVMGFGSGSNLVVCSSLVCMYGNCNDVDGAKSVFESMDYRNIVTWTSMIAACAQNGRGSEALEFFRNFNYGSGGEERANDFMLTSVINACASLGKLATGRASHGAVIRGGHEVNDVVTSSLVDMYAKCGCFDYSWKIFKRIRNPSVVPYTSMIVGAAKYGLGKLSIELFNEMTDRGVKPNDVTFVGVLHGCSHSGLVEQGLELLNSMLEKYGVNPDAKHYTCVVDMYCRVGRLDEAYKLAKSIHVENIELGLLWGTLLSASRLHGRVDITVEASKRLIESKQQVAAAYVTLSNAYALAGEWENAHGMRSQMKRAGVVKDPGCSWIEIRDSTFAFHAGNLSFEGGKEVLSKLKELDGKMKERGYVGGGFGLVFVEVEQEAKEEIVSLHSERLALAFGLITVSKGITIRIMKNLRMCNDCHEAFKVISAIVERDFVVRDVNRFHHFKNGSCSCSDFW
ncbi:Pentatricopeptide repeat-containing protein At4g15720 [Linum grandiflorum]